MTWDEGGIVVGVDGSEHSCAALDWAAAEADLLGVPRVHAFAINDFPSRDEEVWTVLRTVTDRVRAEHPATEITEMVTRGRPASALIEMSERTRLIVVGGRGGGSPAGMRLGSVSTKVATHARCPVVVVREPRARGPVLVGVDGSEQSVRALQFAFEAAAARRGELVAVQFWDVPGPELAIAPPLRDELDLARSESERSLAEQLAGWAERYPEVPVSRVSQWGHPVFGLADRTREAQLLVVGHRGRGGFAGLLLGSVAAGVILHAHCPVAVVRGEEHRAGHRRA
ncbi:universal stress protein [Saccharopolyspora sp. MS10]|uniref:universal stress protein n=1 Tax=Saccharopolyspora sp. MS10 TaxID=3385973 RepID=UPI0039A2D448